MREIIEVLGPELFQQQFADSPQLLAILEASFTGAENAVVRQQLLELSDESAFSLRDWVESMRTLRAWLDVRGLDLSTEDQLGYISCAGASVVGSEHLSHLPALVAEMLDLYACERAVPRAPSP